MSALIAVRLHASAGDEVPLLGRFSYDQADPFAVRVEFFAHQAALPYWCFDRQMLAEGLERPVGEGDVTFRPQWTASGRAIRIGLRDCADGQGAVLHIDAQPVARFLEETYAVTAPGTEVFDADAFLDELLAR
ncbi:SsgA family sporulation/cell division regulator [Streptomyces sp. CB00455]|uniref:SsgA family sporulation/cell division regulator n=1 Tax=Streptomyces sp. CB00455 TaxID=1703927 RepID=UPI001F5B8154|nr:SsgA family sporulation/cell division regulator [Streptomyces sp. CB00455]